MDNINTPPIMETPIESSIPNSPPPKKKTPILTIALCILLAVVLLFLYLLFFTKVLDNFEILKPQQENSQNEEEESEQENEEPELTAFEGTTITASLPDDWSIQEYYNGQGTDMLTDGITYSGLTGLKIFNDNVEMFYLRAIYGIGFAGCPNYAKFEDESITYYNQILSDNQLSGTQLNVTDYTTSEYSEFEWLGKTFRRVERVYNYDTIDNNNYFEPSCVPTLVTLQGLQFVPQGDPPATAYDYGPTTDATLEDLEIIDSILESMTLSN